MEDLTSEINRLEKELGDDILNEGYLNGKLDQTQKICQMILYN